jgi:citrate lyase subunit beta/citryl-CoA lyase
MSPQSPSQMAAARSFLFVPANRPERYAKALASGADAIIIDLEDAVSPSDKPNARRHLAQAFGQLIPTDHARTVVRMNAQGTPFHQDDLLLLHTLALSGLACVMVPKAESLEGLSHVAKALGADCSLMPLIESVSGLDAASALASGPQVVRLAFGNLDFQADLGMSCGPDEHELAPVRLALVLASRRSKLPAPVDGVTSVTQDLTQLQADAARARRSGFGGKLCIHPAQVTGVNEAFTPSVAEQAWAQRVLSAFAAAGGGVFSLDGRMVDAPVVRLAQRTLAQSQQTMDG